MSTSAIWAEGLTKTFGDVVAVKELDLEDTRGEVFGFLGPGSSSATGSTTTITTDAAPPWATHPQPTTLPSAPTDELLARGRQSPSIKGDEHPHDQHPIEGLKMRSDTSGSSCAASACVDRFGFMSGSAERHFAAIVLPGYRGTHGGCGLR